MYPDARLDPALKCGWAHSNGGFGVWHLHSMEQRFIVLRRRIHQAHADWGIELIAYENASFGSERPNEQKEHNETLGVIKLCALELGVPTVGYHPTTMKKWLTGYGKATKQQMVRACETVLGIKTVSEDAADALAVLHMAMRGVQPPQKKPRKKRVGGKGKNVWVKGKRLF